jgi:quinoprotein glucose dehydrogenase
VLYTWGGRQYVVVAAGGHADSGTKKGDYVVAYALPRPGDSGPSLAARLLDQPGRRFVGNLALIALALLAASLAAGRLFARR